MTHAAPRRGIPGEQEYRYRVVEVLAVDEDGNVISGDIREYKTPDGADKCRERWVRAGRSVVVQSGVMRWLGPDEEAHGISPRN